MLNDLAYTYRSLSKRVQINPKPYIDISLDMILQDISSDDDEVAMGAICLITQIVALFTLSSQQQSVVITSVIGKLSIPQETEVTEGALQVLSNLALDKMLPETALQSILSLALSFLDGNINPVDWFNTTFQSLGCIESLVNQKKEFVATQLGIVVPSVGRFLPYHANALRLKSLSILEPFVSMIATQNLLLTEQFQVAYYILRRAEKLCFT